MTGEQLWLKINEPTEKDKGKYAMDIFDGQSGVKRVFDLSGQGGGTRGLSAQSLLEKTVAESQCLP